MRFDRLSRNSVFAHERRGARGNGEVPRPERGFWRQLVAWLTEF